MRRAPGTAYTANELNLWTRIKGAAGTFVKQFLVPAGRACLLSIMDPESHRMAQVALKGEGYATGVNVTSGGAFGFNRLSLANLAPSVLQKLQDVLGKNPLQLKDVLYSVKSIASIAAGTAARAADTILTDNVEGFAVDTLEEGENVVNRETALW